MQLPELLAPAGGLAQLKTAYRFGADAVYCGMKDYGLRAFAGNLSAEEFAEAVGYAHALGRRLYVTLNILAYDDDLPGMLAAAHTAFEAGADAAIVSDIGALDMLHRELPGLELHISTQANVMNARTAAIAHELGAKRIILARELSLTRIRALRAALPAEVELEAFVHGAVCMSYSGRCTLSNYLTSREANQGACSQPCRWKYAVVEEKRPGQYMPVVADEHGTYIFSAGDLRMIRHLPDLCAAGLVSLKIEGRMKNEYYVATVVGTYRRALDAYAANPTAYLSDAPFLDTLEHELDKVSHRPSDTGFFYGQPDMPGGADGFSQTAEFTGPVLAYDAGTRRALIELRNRILVGDTIEALMPAGIHAFKLANIELAETGESVDCCAIPKTRVWINVPCAVEAGDMLRGPNRNHHLPQPH